MSTITFGKYYGCDISDVDTGYLRWMLATASGNGSKLDVFVEENRDLIEDAIRAVTLNAMADIPEYTLNESQQLAADALVAWLDHAEPVAVLEGGAGYGKSFTVLDIARRAIREGWTVAACATSRVATDVLAKQLDPLGVEVRTIASMLRLDKVYDGPKSDYVPGDRTPERLDYTLRDRHLLIVDEYSMVGNPIDKLLIHAATRRGGKLLAVGDLRQLPPVGQDHRSEFANVATRFALTEPMRYARDSDLFRLEQMARASRDISSQQLWANSQEVHVHRDGDSILDQFVTDYRENPNEDCRMVAYRRDHVVQLNNAIRHKLFGEQSARAIVEDERLMVLATTDVYLRDAQGNAVDTETSRWYSGTTFRVEELREGVIAGVPCFLVRFIGSNVFVPVLFGVSETKANADTRGGDVFNARRTELFNEAVETGNWSAYRAFTNTFVMMGYNYAMTVHRCQGQTVDRVYFPPVTLRGAPKVGDALLYVAATRAKRAVHMLITTRETDR